MKTRWLLLTTALLGALWPVWIWYVSRMSDGSDEPWGIAALLLALGLGLRSWRPRPIGTLRILAGAALLGLYAWGFADLPPLVRAILAVSALAVFLSPGRGAIGIWGLLILSLPMLATLQFYLGYPLRVLTAGASAWLLDQGGLDVTRTGLTLWWRGESVSVDAPCSGIRMLWGSLVLACGLCAGSGLRALPTFAALAATFVVVVGANIVRATLLFYKEAHVVRLPEWTHAGIGCVCFAVAVLAIFQISKLCAREPAL
jgi:exosortase/archaeosortase family protein